MRVDLRYAALNQDTERRVRLAASALAAHQIRAAASEWDGTRCDFVVVDAADQYGRHVIEIAKRKGFGVFAFGGESQREVEGVVWLPTQTNVATLATVLRDALAARHSGGPAPAQVLAPGEAPASVAAARKESHTAALPGDSDSSALVRLGTDATLMQIDLEATLHGRTIHLLPSAGRVLATSLSDLLGTREKLSESGWEFTPLSSRRGVHPVGEVSASLDVYYLYGALRGRSSLPSIPAIRYSLRDWPDLGAAPELTDALQVVRVLQRGNALPAEIASICAMSDQDVSACLWALNAAGLLTQGGDDRAAATVSEASKPVSSLLGRLAAHFGLRLK